jgi:tetratricopeptide (TPR) repeat protein
LLETGFIAVNQSDEDSALKLFKAAKLLDPKNILPDVGLGYLYLHKLDLKQACAMFEKVLEVEPENEMAKTLLGICMSLAPPSLKKGEKILDEMCKAHDPMIRQLSETAVSFVEQCIKKSPSPAETQKKARRRPKL